MGIRIADPLPAFCSSCHNAQPDVRHIDFDAAHDAGCFVNELGAYVAGQDDLVVCERCLREALEALELKPQLEAMRLRELKRLRVENEHWREEARAWKNRAAQAADERLGEPQRPRKRVAA